MKGTKSLVNCILNVESLDEGGNLATGSSIESGKRSEHL